ncbi:unnamed protein product [Camellia sinensis]
MGFPMASSGGEIPGLVPEKGELIPPGKPMSTEQQLLDKGAQMMQSLNPVNQINQHVCTFASYSQDLTRQIVTHHYLTRLNQDFIQCAVYDTDDSHGRLIGSPLSLSLSLSIYMCLFCRCMCGLINNICWEVFSFWIN